MFDNKEVTGTYSGRKVWSKPSDVLGRVSLSNVHLEYVLPTMIDSYQGSNRPVPVEVVE
jgi:hypothetical protein